VIAIETGIGIVTEITGMVDVTMRFPGKGITTVMTTMIRAANGDTRHTLFSISTMVCWWVSSVVRFLLHPVFVKGKVGGTHRMWPCHLKHDTWVLRRKILNIQHDPLRSSLEHRLPDASGDFVVYVIDNLTVRPAIRRFCIRFLQSVPLVRYCVFYLFLESHRCFRTNPILMVVSILF